LQTSFEQIETLKKTLLQHEKFVFGTQPKLAHLSSTYELQAINTDMKLSTLLDSSMRFLEHIRQHSSPEIQNMNLLLQGPPGTGKTEFVKYLAETLGVELIIKRLSDIRSKWYGESLQNIAKMFQEAQAKESVLFLDEADTFFMDRQSSHDHYNAETNELLTQMENFKGILVCATNFGGSMDAAVMRRFNHKVKFDYLSAEGKRVLFQKMLLPLSMASESDELLDKVAAIPALTPGDFKVVRQKNFFQEINDPYLLIQQLENEVSYKKSIAKPVKLV
jgi:transitional endoplasmic reticulum ATPase